MSDAGSRRDTDSQRDGRSTIRRLLVNESEGRPRAGWRLAGWLFVVLVAAVLGVTVGQGLATIAPVGGGRALVATVGAIGTYALVTAAVLAYARWVDRRSVAGLGLGGEGFRGSLTVGLGLGIAMATTVVIALAILGHLRIDGVLAVDPASPLPPGTAVPEAVVGGLPAVAVLAVLAAFFVAVGVAEEVLVRGYLLTNVAEGLAGLGPVTGRAATGTAVLATGGLFGVLHLANPGASLRSAALIAAVGVALGWAYVVTGDLGIPIGVHVTWNFALSTVYGVPVSGLAPPASVLSTAVTGDPHLTGGAFGPEAGLVMLAPLALLVVATAWWRRRTGGDRRGDRSIARYDPPGSDNHEG